MELDFESSENIKARVARIMRSILADVREARSAIERGQTEAAIERLRHLEKELAASELEAEGIDTGEDDTEEG